MSCRVIISHYVCVRPVRVEMRLQTACNCTTITGEYRGFVELAMPNDLETSPPVSPALFETIPPTGLPSTERPIFSRPTESFAREFQWISWWNLKHIATWCKNRPLRESRICPFLPYFRSTSIDSHAEIFWNIWQIWWGLQAQGTNLRSDSRNVVRA